MIEAIAYSRATTPGIPPGNTAASPTENPFPVQYFVFIVVKKDAPVSIKGVCLKGQSYSAKLERVRSPVVVPHDVNVPTDRQDTLVQKTSDDVYRVILKEPQGNACQDLPPALRPHHEVVVVLSSGESLVFGAAKSILPLAPAAAM